MNKTHDFKLNMPDYSDAVDIDILNDNFRVIDDALMAGLCEKEYTGNNMGSSDPASRKYAWAPWFEIKNENDFDVQVTDRNFETTITIEAGTTYRKYIVGTYYMNFYVQDQHDVTFRWFTDAETRINEIDPSGGGSVSSVNVTGASSSHIVTSGGPITSSGTIEIDLAEGYSIPQTNKQTSWDGKAADLKAEIDSSTYVLTLQLKDSAGNLIGNERTIDLPLETMVVDGEYDPQSKKIKLELKNGNYVEFSVADLVSGLQTELSSSNKLDPTYIAYDATHRAVSDTEKDTWNGKQNAISDLETIRSGAAAGATAVQPSVMEDALDDKQDSIDGSHKLSSDLVDDTNKTNKFVTSTEKNTWNSKQNALTFDDAPTSGSNNPVKSGGIYTALSGKQGTIDSSHKLSSALVSFSTAQNAALSSGIDSTKVSQISTNQTNILYSTNMGVKNLLASLLRVATVGSSNSTITFALQGDGSIVLNGSTTSSVAIFVITESGRWATTGVNGVDESFENISYKIALFDGGNASGSGVYLDMYHSGWADRATCGVGGNTTFVNPYILRLCVPENKTLNNVIVKPMVCTLDAWNQSSDYQPPALPNYDLTRLEAEDRASLAEVVDSGAKNLLDFANLQFQTQGGTTYTKTDTDITVTSSSAWAACTYKMTLSAGNYIFSAKISNLSIGTGGSAKICLDTDHGGHGTRAATIDVAQNGTVSGAFTWGGGTLYIMYYPNYTATAITTTFKASENMICTKAAFGVSKAFVPYRPNYDLVCDKVANFGITKIIPSFTPSAANTYECVTATKITLPANKVLRINVACIFQNSYATGIKLVRGTTMENAKTLAISESTADYNALPISTVCSFSSDQDIYVFLKCNSTGTTKLVMAYDII